MPDDSADFAAGTDTTQYEPAPEVPIGISTQAGLATWLAAYVVAIVAFISGDSSGETIAALVVGTISLVSVIWSRATQARELIRRQATLAIHKANGGR